MVLEGLQGFNFNDLINSLLSVGVYDVVLPFLLVFAIIFAILEKTKILGKDKSNINAIVSLVAGFLVVAQTGIVQTINLFIPRVSLIIIVVIMGLMIISLLYGSEYKGITGVTFSIVIVIIIIAVIFALTTPAGYGNSWLTPTDVQILISLGVPILILFGVIKLVTGSSEKSKPREQRNPTFFERMAEDYDRAHGYTPGSPRAPPPSGGAG